MTNTTTTPAAIHPFERAGLGRAPFRCVEMIERTYIACPGAPSQPGGACEYCGNGIKFCFVIKSADGKRFEVGSDCVARTNQECARTDAERAARALHDSVNKVRTARANARKDARIAAARAYLAEHREALEALPWNGVSEHRNHAPRSVADQLEWMLGNGGRALKMRAVALVEALRGDAGEGEE